MPTKVKTDPFECGEPYVDAARPPEASVIAGETWKQVPRLPIRISSTCRVFLCPKRGGLWREIRARMHHRSRVQHISYNNRQIYLTQLFALAFLQKPPYRFPRARLCDPTQPISINNIRWNLITPITAEQWCPICETQSVSDHGRLRNDVDGQELTVPNKDYPEHSYIRDGKHCTKGVHLLVAEAYIPIVDPTKNTVNHKDGNPRNNKASNLEWATSGEQLAHASKHGLLRTRIVVRIGEDGKRTVYPSITKAADDHGVKRTSIEQAIRVRGKSAGFRWEYGGPPRNVHAEQTTVAGEIFLPLPENPQHPKHRGVLASTHGRIRSKHGHIMKNAPGGTVWLDGRNYTVSHLVAITHLGPPPIPDAAVGHKDRDRHNNRVENLFWLDRRRPCPKRRIIGSLIPEKRKKIAHTTK